MAIFAIILIILSFYKIDGCNHLILSVLILLALNKLLGNYTVPLSTPSQIPKPNQSLGEVMTLFFRIVLLYSVGRFSSSSSLSIGSSAFIGYLMGARDRLGVYNEPTIYWPL